MKRFREDLQLAPIVAQFVPFHLDTRKQEWQAWARKHPHDGNGIPIVYVVRSDGETLYAKTGAPQGDDLPRLLVAQLTRSGKAITPTHRRGSMLRRMPLLPHWNRKTKGLHWRF